MLAEDLQAIIELIPWNLKGDPFPRPFYRGLFVLVRDDSDCHCVSFESVSKKVDKFTERSVSFLWCFVLRKKFCFIAIV